MEVHKFTWMSEKAEFKIWNLERNKEMRNKKCVTKKLVRTFRNLSFWFSLRANQLNSFYIWNIWMNTVVFPNYLQNFQMRH